MYTGLRQLSWKHCSVFFTFFSLKNLMTNEAESSTDKLYYCIHAVLHSQLLRICVIAKISSSKGFKTLKMGVISTWYYQLVWLYSILQGVFKAKFRFGRHENLQQKQIERVSLVSFGHQLECLRRLLVKYNVLNIFDSLVDWWCTVNRLSQLRQTIDC